MRSRHLAVHCNGANFLFFVRRNFDGDLSGRTADSSGARGLPPGSPQGGRGGDRQTGAAEPQPNAVLLNFRNQPWLGSESCVTVQRRTTDCTDDTDEEWRRSACGSRPSYLRIQSVRVIRGLKPFRNENTKESRRILSAAAMAVLNELKPGLDEKLYENAC